MIMATTAATAFKCFLSFVYFAKPLVHTLLEPPWFVCCFTNKLGSRISVIRSLNQSEGDKAGKQLPQIFP